MTYDENHSIPELLVLYVSSKFLKTKLSTISFSDLNKKPRNPNDKSLIKAKLFTSTITIADGGFISEFFLPPQRQEMKILNVVQFLKFEGNW